MQTPNSGVKLDPQYFPVEKDQRDVANAIPFILPLQLPLLPSAESNRNYNSQIQCQLMDSQNCRAAANQRQVFSQFDPPIAALRTQSQQTPILNSLQQHDIPLDLNRLNVLSQQNVGQNRQPQLFQQSILQDPISKSFPQAYQPLQLEQNLQNQASQQLKAYQISLPGNIISNTPNIHFQGGFANFFQIPMVIIPAPLPICTIQKTYVPIMIPIIHQDQNTFHGISDQAYQQSIQPHDHNGQADDLNNLFKQEQLKNRQVNHSYFANDQDPANQNPQDKVFYHHEPILKESLQHSQHIADGKHQQASPDDLFMKPIDHIFKQYTTEASSAIYEKNLFGPRQMLRQDVDDGTGQISNILHKNSEHLNAGTRNHQSVISESDSFIHQIKVQNHHAQIQASHQNIIASNPQFQSENLHQFSKREEQNHYQRNQIGAQTEIASSVNSNSHLGEQCQREYEHEAVSAQKSILIADNIEKNSIQPQMIHTRYELHNSSFQENLSQNQSGLIHSQEINNNQVTQVAAADKQNILIPENNIYKVKELNEQKHRKLNEQNHQSEEKKQRNLEIVESVRQKFNQSQNYQYLIRSGSEIDLSKFQGRLHVPSTRNFTQIKFVNKHTKRTQSAFFCEEDDFRCKKLFKKWHNLFDHMRIHTGEKPFECPVADCDYAFNQISNQKKHLLMHKNLDLPCKVCGQLMNKNIIISHFEYEHNFKVVRIYVNAKKRANQANDCSQ